MSDDSTGGGRIVPLYADNAPVRRPDLDERVDAIERLMRMQHAQVMTQLELVLSAVQTQSRNALTERDRTDITERDIVRHAAELAEHRERLDKLDRAAKRRLKRK